MSYHVQAVSHDLLVRDLGQVPQWDVLGIYLGLNESEIQVIEHDHHDTARRRLVMLSKWMEKDVNVTWEKVIEALRNMSLIRLANQLKGKYCTTKSNSPDVAVVPTLADPSPVKELIVKRQESIAQEIEKLEMEYLSLTADVESAMSETNPSVMKLKRFSKFYLNNKLTTIEELFDKLPTNFLDHVLIDKVVKFFLRQHPVADTLSDYCLTLTKFLSSTTVQQFMESIEEAQQSQSTTQSERHELCTVKLCLVGGWLEKTMEDLEKLVIEIFQDKRHVLTHLKIVRGSVIVTFTTPLREADSLTAFLMERSSFALKVGVSELVVNNTVITKSAQLTFSFESSLLDSIKDNHPNILNFLLSINTYPNAVDEVNQTALSIASALNQVKSIKLLLKANANPNFQQDDGRTPLYIASQEGHIEIVALLLKNNANPDLGIKGCTPLYVASQNGHTDVVALLLRSNANPDLKETEVCTPLCIASQNGHIEVVTLLLKNNANPNLQGGTYPTPLYIASQYGHTDIASLLLENNAYPDLQEREGNTPLHVASYNGHTDVVALLLRNNANPNLQASKGSTPLYFASLEGHTDIVSLLLKANANVNLEYDGTTPLYIANHHGHTDIVTLLQDAGADTSIQPQTKGIFSIQQEGRSDVLTSFQKANPHLEYERHAGTTPPYMANKMAQTDDIQLFLGDEYNTS